MSPMIDPADWIPQGVEGLEPTALEVVRSAKNELIVAGPGAGKTELLAQRASFLLQTNRCTFPKRILAISFKKDAATNLKDRVQDRCGTDLASRFDSLTFDAFAKSLLDRFSDGLPDFWKPSNDYEISSTNYRHFDDFLNEFQRNQIPVSEQMQGQSRPRTNAFTERYIFGSPLTVDHQSSSDIWVTAASLWWRQRLQGTAGRSQLDFPMIQRLTELALRINPILQSAIQATYSHVFLDEFQDTTGPQYDLVLAAFRGSKVVLTAVGDKKQQIMRWAGALDDAFERYEEDFRSHKRALISNYRSSPELVRIQHVLARAVDNDYVDVESQVIQQSVGSVCTVFEYLNPRREAEHIAQIIEESMAERSLKPRNFAVLVRQKTTDYESELAEAFMARGLRIRDENVIQDLLAERLTSIVVPFLKLGCVDRGGDLWLECTEITEALWAIRPDDELAVIPQRLSKLHDHLRLLMQTGTYSEAETRQILDEIIDHLGRPNIKNEYQEYRQGDWMNNTENELVRLLTQSCRTSENWQDGLAEFEGENIVPLMTIHKSKGLEYDTVFFVGLDDNAWWSFARQPEESRSTFFVAFSRAKQSVAFTYCEQRDGKSQVASLYDLLQDAGVQTQAIE